MSDNIQIAASTRSVIGKTAHRMAGTGRLPGVLYGARVDATPVEVDRHDFEQLLAHEGGVASKLVELTVDGDKPVNVIIKAMQRDAVKGTVQHVDFWAIDLTQKITTSVPLHFVGEAPGVKAGGVLTHNMRELSIEALPTALPEAVEADISALEIGDSLHISALPIPDGVVLHAAEDEIVCSVLAPKAIEEEVPEEELEGVEGEEGEEPEVIGESEEETSEE